uniref:F-box domain-containing protein n=1 Tax=Ditylenchus dipsaci TaxID=166011 RepID=A0A915E6E5_9BILA
MNADNFRSVLAFFARHELQRLSLVNRQIYQCIQRDFGDAPYVWLEHISYLNGEFNWAISFSSLSACRFLRSHLFSFISPPPLQIMPQIQHVWQDAELRGTFDTGAQLTAQVGQAIAKSWKLCFYSTADTLIGSALNVLHILLKVKSYEDPWVPLNEDEAIEIKQDCSEVWDDITNRVIGGERALPTAHSYAVVLLDEMLNVFCTGILVRPSTFDLTRPVENFDFRPSIENNFCFNCIWSHDE